MLFYEYFELYMEKIQIRVLYRVKISYHVNLYETPCMGRQQVSTFKRITYYT